MLKLIVKIIKITIGIFKNIKLYCTTTVAIFKPRTKLHKPK